MNKSELIDEVAAFTSLPKSTVDKVLDGLKNVIHMQLRNGQEVTLHGVGKFKNHRSKERQGKNPKTGHTITIAAKNRAKFYSSKSLDDSLN